uniref:S8 family peptidase n=1 Tax=Agathobacter sp. TaxID=2021311 RepID=UPI00405679CB
MSESLKIETLFRAALNATPLEREKSDDLATGFFPMEDTWEVIVRYFGDLSSLADKYPSVEVIELFNNYGILRVPASLVDTIAAEDIITYMEKPKRLFYEVDIGRRASCVTALQSRFPQLTGRGVLVGIIDSGIDYSHPDFLNPNGTTRILALWDQTIPPETVSGAASPEGYPLGTLFGEAVINQALQAATPQERLAICPSQDISGHGTHVCGICAGNGRASDGRYRGVAPEADLLVVKLGIPGENSFPSTSLLMMAVDFCVRESIARNVPLALNLSFGNTYGSHSGSSLLETYLDSAATLGKSLFVIGSGNEGASAGHIGGTLEENRTQSIQFTVSDFTPSLNIQLWKNYWDEFTVTLTSPTNAAITLPSTSGAWRFSLGETELYSFNGEPTPYSPFQEIYMDLLPADSYITTGVWTIQLIPQNIRNGIWDMWLPSSAIRSEATGFLLPTPETTLTIPSTSARSISVGAYDHALNAPAIFSGRGFTWNNQFIKPELVAPGVNITSCAPGGGYETRSGTSMATPFVTGSSALLMQWGILEGNDSYLYGEKLKAYLIRGTRPLPGFSKYPNPQAGWGALCVSDSIPL